MGFEPDEALVPVAAVEARLEDVETQRVRQEVAGGHLLPTRSAHGLLWLFPSVLLVTFVHVSEIMACSRINSCVNSQTQRDSLSRFRGSGYGQINCSHAN